jgi:hypothetical protein
MKGYVRSYDDDDSVCQSVGLPTAAVQKCKTEARVILISNEVSVHSAGGARTAKENKINCVPFPSSLIYVAIQEEML